MQKLKLSATIFFAFVSSICFSQSSQTVLKYIDTYKDIAIQEEIRTGVPAAITLAQGIHETGAGTSHLVISSNNHFGIKCKSDWKGASVFHDDDAKGECFRKYEDPMDSYKDHSDFLKNRPYYASLFTLDPVDYKAWAYGLKKAGYATNPKYAQILIQLIEKYNLQNYTLIALGKKNGVENEPVYAGNNNSVIKEEAEVEATPVVVKTFAYPEGVFKINETSVLLIPKGTSFLKIAMDHDLSLSRLFEFNDMKAVDVTEKDVLVYLQRKRKTGATEFHIAVAGESFWDIAQVEGIRLENLMEYNSVKSGMQPVPGEKIFLQGKPSAQANTVDKGQVAFRSDDIYKVSGSAYVVHVVQPRETVYAISKKYAVGTEDLVKWNELPTYDLKTGQRLRILKKTVDATN